MDETQEHASRCWTRGTNCLRLLQLKAIFLDQRSQTRCSLIGSVLKLNIEELQINFTPAASWPWGTITGSLDDVCLERNKLTVHTSCWVYTITLVFSFSTAGIQNYIPSMSGMEWHPASHQFICRPPRETATLCTRTTGKFQISCNKVALNIFVRLKKKKNHILLSEKNTKTSRSERLGLFQLERSLLTLLTLPTLSGSLQCGSATRLPKGCSFAPAQWRGKKRHTVVTSPAVLRQHQIWWST